jgi:hypothetical protein
MTAILHRLRVGFEAKPANCRARLYGATEEPDGFVVALSNPAYKAHIHTDDGHLAPALVLWLTNKPQ